MLSLVREGGSTARVLNLSLVHERAGQTEEYRSAPIFKSGPLNKSLILKHVLRPNERCLFLVPPVSTTKVIVPLDPSDLRMGGRTALVGDVRFESDIKLMGRYTDDASAQSDIQLLELLNSLPSFDPFLMRERLRQNGHNPARCYFNLSEADVARMRTFVAKEIEQLVALAYANGGDSARDLSTKLADKLMTDETAKSLDPLRIVLKLSEEEYREGIFAWKGFLYYDWSHKQLDARVTDLLGDMRSLRAIGGGPQARWHIDDVRERLLDFLSIAEREVSNALAEYSTAFAALTRGQSKDFREFLLRAPQLFVTIGEALGSMMHIESFWQFRFPPGSPRTMDADEAIGMFADFEATLGGTKMVSDAAVLDGNPSPYSAIRSR